MTSRARASRFVLTTAAVVMLGGFLAPSVSFAVLPAPLSTPSDPRAQFVPGNVVTCAGAGIVSTPGVNIIQLGAQENNPASDPNVSGVVTSHAGGGEELNITIGANVVIDAVIAKGGDGYNKYSSPTVLPPALTAPNQHYISPLNGGGNVPKFSHWFVCYHETTPLPTGTLQVTKAVQLPDGRPVTPLPTSFSALVNCNDGIAAHQNVIMNFTAGGGRSTSQNLTGIPIGAVCTVVEQGGGAPVVTYTPVGSDTPGVTFLTGNTGVVVNITNDFSTVAVQRGTLHFSKVLLPLPAGVDPPPSFTVEVACDDGTHGFVTLPGTGGPGTPDISVRTLSLCTLIEDISTLAPGWTRTYSVNGGPPSATPPFVTVTDTSTIAITVTNDGVAVEAPVPSTTVAPAPPTTSAVAGVGPGTGSGALPITGRSSAAVAGLAALLIVGGLATLRAGRRPSRRGS